LPGDEFVNLYLAPPRFLRESGVLTTFRGETTRGEEGAVMSSQDAFDLGATSGNRLRPGAPVEVRNRYVGSWSGGFAVDHAEPDGYVIRRMSDGQSLPATFRPEEVRPT
jgi:hypothetical protein